VGGPEIAVVTATNVGTLIVVATVTEKSDRSCVEILLGYTQ
jgi:hypothetical protein